MKTFLNLFIASLLLVACSKEPPITNAMLDGDLIFDPSLYNPEEFLVSAKIPNPTPADLERHVIIAAHGYSATTFEWQEFQDWSADSSYLVSQVLLDGHGRTYESFRNTNWEGWQNAILTEYIQLHMLGYRKISFVGSSTGGALLLNMLHDGYFNDLTVPKNIFLIDPIVVPSTKLQSIAGLVGPMLVYAETDQTAKEDKYWYRFRPHETIDELNELIRKVQKDLEKGYRAPAGTFVKTFHSKHDPAASSTSTVLIYKGLSLSNGGRIEAQIMDSDIHVFTRLSLRQSVTSIQQANQQDAFIQMANRLK